MSYDGGSDEFEDADFVQPGRRSTCHQASATSSLYSMYEDKVRQFIDVIDELRRQGLNEDIDLPAVVVVGDQSSGKSSILEAISGVALPRGSGIQTRCPLELQMKRSRDKRPQVWRATLSYKDMSDKYQTHQINDPNAVEDLIRRAQNEIAGCQKGISKSVITLNVESPKCPDLTLIDLPGIALIPVDDQPADIGDQTKQMIHEYIKRPETIILCVAPAEVDIPCNDCLVIARSVDPQGLRTMVAITKPDLKNRGTEGDIVDVLKNKKIPLKLGYRIVRCRTQQDIIDKVDLSQALKDEAQFFEEHPVYRKINPDLRGTVNLSGALSDVLVDHIKKFIPRLRSEVRRQMESTTILLKGLGEAPPAEPSGRRLYFINAAKTFCEGMADVLKNQTKISKSIVPRIEGEVGTDSVMLSYLWRRSFGQLKRKIEELTTSNFESGEFVASRIQGKMISYRGSSLPGFINYDLFEDLVKEHVLQYENLTIECLEEISSDLMVVMIHVSDECLSHVPSIKENIRGICEKVHKECKEEGRRLLRLEMKKECLVFSQDFTYLEQLTKSLEPNKELNYRMFHSEDDIAVHNSDVMRELMQVYLTIANRRISDSVPMLLRSTQFDEFIETLKDRINDMAVTDNTEELIHEDPRLTRKRTDFESKQRRLEDAMRMLNRQ